MDEQRLRATLADLAAGKCSVEQALEVLARAPFVDLGHSRLDVHRALRCGFEEVVYAAGKELPQLLDLVEASLSSSGRALLTRLNPEHLQPLAERFPEMRINPRSRTASIVQTPAPRLPGSVAVISAGTSDAPVAEEAEDCAEFLGLSVSRITDVGVAGLPRLIDALDEIRRHDVLIVVAGMEGALPGVIGGLTAAPIIAVPTSIGYGASFGGITALCGMLISCSPGLTVVNIDNGFGAALAAAKMVRHLKRREINES